MRQETDLGRANVGGKELNLVVWYDYGYDQGSGWIGAEASGYGMDGMPVGKGKGKGRKLGVKSLSLVF